jgi:transcriptional regulator with XRE-family HTH domain
MKQRGPRQPKQQVRQPSLPQNVVRPTVRRLRYAQKLTQDLLAARCAVAGCDISRGTLAKIEARIRGVSDVELFAIAQVLRVPIEDLFPESFKRLLKHGGF